MIGTTSTRPDASSRHVSSLVEPATGSISVSPGGSFRARDDNGRTVFNVKGQINRNKSFGTFRYSGRVETTTGSTRSCDTGKITWVTRP